MTMQFPISRLAASAAERLGAVPRLKEEASADGSPAPVAIEPPSARVDGATGRIEPVASAPGGLAEIDPHQELEPTAWIGAIERITFLAARNGVRVLGLVGADPRVGVSLFAELLAESYARSGRKALLVDLTRPVVGVDDGSGWAPGLRAADGAICPDDRGFDRLSPRPSAATRSAFNNVESVRRAFQEELGGYDAVVVDLAPVLDADGGRINAVAAALACDGVLLVAMTGRTRRDRVARASALLREAGASIVGVVLNDSESRPVGQELGDAARVLRRISPGLARWLEKAFRSAPILN